MIRAAIITIHALLCNSCQVGQDTLCINSLYDSLIYVTNLFMVSNFNLGIARVERFELPSTVLETAILPLNYTRKKAKSY